MQVESTQLFKVKDVAGMFAVSSATVYRLVESGELPALRFGTGKGSLRVRGEAVNAYLAACTVPTRPTDQEFATVVRERDDAQRQVADLESRLNDTYYDRDVLAAISTATAQEA
ncbi:MAG TPA: helix-turn-helix domain-containing protein [Pseudonocardiaceae bacterium]|nr:helix-turn-helix domain-containing protein [Pseudonocardiaceae bacterium]